MSSWAADYQKLVEIDYPIAADCAKTLAAIVNVCELHLQGKKTQLDERHLQISNMHKELRHRWKTQAIACRNIQPMMVPAVLYEIGQTIQDEDWSLVNFGSIPTGNWVRKLWKFENEDSYLGFSGGAGLGYGPGASIGAALAHKESGKLCINLQADGDFLFTPSALWTAAHYRVPLLIIVLNNRCYKNTREHSEKIAEIRLQEGADTPIGSMLDNPYVDFPKMAASYGIKTFESVSEITMIQQVLKEAIAEVKKGQPVLIDLIIQ